MKKGVTFLLVIAALAVAFFYFVATPQSSVDGEPTEAQVRAAAAELEIELARAVIDVREFGGTDVVLVDGEATFSIDGDGDAPAGQGFIEYGEVYGAFWRGLEAEVHALYYINAGGTGTFPYLISLTYEDGNLVETSRVVLGDRIGVSDIHIEQSEPNNYEIWVSLVERLPRQGMTAQPTVPMVLRFVRGSAGLILGDVAYGTLENYSIAVSEPLPESTVGTTFTVRGEAVGPWYFEAVFPVELQDFSGTILTQTAAQAQGEWMTTSLVPFTATVTAPAGATGLYILVLRRDNPSGEAQFDESIQIPIVIK